MALLLADVLSPAGDITGSVWFPGTDPTAVNTLVTGFIADAVTKSDDEASQEQWVYYRAATAVADRVASEAASKTLTLVDQGAKSSTMLQAQIQYWIDKAAAYLAAFNAAEADVIDDPLGGFSVLTSLRHGGA